MQPKYPIYIISKGRWKTRLTQKALERMKVDYKIVVEPQEYDNYAKYIDKSKILTTPFSNLGQGSIPVRNFVWEHSIQNGHKKHWVLDDNIQCFYRLNNNIKIKVENPIVFKIIEDFTDRYTNIGLSGMDYSGFVPALQNRPPYNLNTRIYSCILINNELPFRWRGKYNEDTDLSLRVLKSGLCTVLFRAICCEKRATMRMKGGNTDTIYKEDFKRLNFAQSLKQQHPDCVKIVQRFNRFHHEVDYTRFKQKLIFKDNVILKNKVNNYGMVLTIKKTGEVIE